MPVETARRSGAKVIVQMIDLDHFKPVNDRLGHAAGDALLQQVAGRMRDTVRGSDTLARVGGDEFALLQTDVSDPDVGGVVADKLIQALMQPFEIDGAGNDRRQHRNRHFRTIGTPRNAADAPSAVEARLGRNGFRYSPRSSTKPPSPAG